MTLIRALRILCLPALLLGTIQGCASTQPHAGTPAVAASWQTIKLLHPRDIPTATLLPDGRVLVTGQDRFEPEGSTPAAEIYDPSLRAFQPGPVIDGHRGEAAAALVAQGVVIAGGGAKVSVVDVARMETKDVATMLVQRGPLAIAPLPDSTLLFVGTGRAETAATTEIYDPRTQSLTKGADVLFKRLHCPATVLSDGRVLLTGGTSCDEANLDRSINDAEIYDPSARTFTATGFMILSRADHTATLLTDGRVLLTGGINDVKGVTASAEIYDPATGRFREIAPMLVARSKHAAVRLADGRVLITGGAAPLQGEDRILKSCEIFDPVHEQFVETAPMATGRQDHSATLLVDGEVLVVGGWTGPESAKTAELYRLGESGS